MVWYGDLEVRKGERYPEREFVSHVPADKLTQEHLEKFKDWEDCGYDVRVTRSAYKDGWVEFGLRRMDRVTREVMRGKLLHEVSDLEFERREKMLGYRKNKVRVEDRDYGDMEERIERLHRQRTIILGKDT